MNSVKMFLCAYLLTLTIQVWFKGHVMTQIELNLDSNLIRANSHIWDKRPRYIWVRSKRKSDGGLGHVGRAAHVQDLLNDVDFNESIQSFAELPDGAANRSLLHFPALQHLVDHFFQAVAVVIVTYGLDFNIVQAQPACTALPVVPNVLCQQIQVRLCHSMAL